MKFLLSFLLVLIVSFKSEGQLAGGLNPQEAKEMIMLCNSFTYLDLHGSDREIIPKGYKKIYTSPTLGMDNVFQVYTNGKKAAFNFRGSTSSKISWMENLYSAMIPVEGKITIQDRTYNYKFGNNEKSNIHSGYALSIMYLRDEIIGQIKSLNRKGIYDILITGHSQGGALAILLRSYLDYEKSISSKNNFKVYSFAQPMSGNFEFAQEYTQNFCENEMSFSFINPEDIVPSMPMSYNDSSFIQDKIAGLISGKEEFNASALLTEGLMAFLGDKLKPTAAKLGQSVEKQIKAELGKLTLPEPTGDINFAQVGNQKQLLPPEYPLELKDSSVLDDPVFLKQHPRDKNGEFDDKSLYKKTTILQNHKPYNYYTGILRKYFKEDYRTIDPKSFGL